MGTKLEKTASVLAYRLELVEAIGENVPDAVIVVDRQGVIDYVNEQAQVMFGYTEQEMLGQRVEMLMPDDAAQAHPGFREEFNEEPRPRAMGIGRNTRGKDKDGRVFKVEIELKPKATTRGTRTIAYVRRRPE